ncbi:MAG TPA: hypothetical protein VLV86_22110 [Vicinamibacterales bacterium]|nr:hypothetical protein [Vicinamibacterales bacterium]
MASDAVGLGRPSALRLGHVDASRTRDEIAASIHALAMLPPPTIGARVDVDTTAALDLEVLAATISHKWR